MQGNQRTRVVAVTFLLAMIGGVLVFGRREQATRAEGEADADLMLRHPLALNVEGPPGKTIPEDAWQQGNSPTAPDRRLVPIPSAAGAQQLPQQLVALPPHPNALTDPDQPAVHPPAAEPPPVPQRTHRIVEGDSLKQLAERYLGSPDRAWELYEANRHVLTAPDLLPLGQRLVIPPAEAPKRVAPPPTSRPLVPLE